MTNKSIQEHLDKSESVDEQNSISEDNNRKKLDNEIPESKSKYGTRDICNGVPNWRELSVAVLYKPNQEEFPPTVIGYFIISDDWDEQSLLELKEKVGADFLVALQTDSSDDKRYFEHLDIVNNVIKCQPSEVDNIIKLLNEPPRDCRRPNILREYDNENTKLHS